MAPMNIGLRFGSGDMTGGFAGGNGLDGVGIFYEPASLGEMKLFSLPAVLIKYVSS